VVFLGFGQFVIVFGAVEEEAEEEIRFAGFAWDT
jgi:hypothetical protein